MLGTITRLYGLVKIYGMGAFPLLINPLLGRESVVKVGGEKFWLNRDSATFYHLRYSMDKIARLVGAIPSGIDGAIVDGGANHGIFSKLAAKRFPGNKVFAVEPYPRILSFLEKNMAGTDVTVVKKALAAEDGELIFYAAPSSDQVGSTIRDHVEEFVKKGALIETTKVEAVSLKTFLKQQGISKIGALKLDVQGLEYAIIKDADEVLALTDCLLLEVILIEKTSFDLLEKARRFFPFHQVVNPLPYGADIVFSKRPFTF